MKRSNRPSPATRKRAAAAKPARQRSVPLKARGTSAAAKPRAAKRGAKPARRSAAPVAKAGRAAPSARAGHAAPRQATRALPKKVTVHRTPAPAPDLHWTETLRDGTHVIIRPISKADAALERRFIERLSPESRRMRFLGQITQPSEAMIRQFTDIDYERDMAFIALVHRDGETLEIGVSRFSLSPDGTSCECAVTVSDEWHNKGLATLLMRHLIEVARARGISSMLSYDAVENTEMRQLADFLGFARITDPDDPHMVIHRLALQ